MLSEINGVFWYDSMFHFFLARRAAAASVNRSSSSLIDGVYGLRRSDQFTFASLALRARKKWNIEYEFY
jgi:hypothetical protein